MRNSKIMEGIEEISRKILKAVRWKNNGEKRKNVIDNLIEHFRLALAHDQIHQALKEHPEALEDVFRKIFKAHLVPELGSNFKKLAQELREISEKTPQRPSDAVYKFLSKIIEIEGFRGRGYSVTNLRRKINKRALKTESWENSRRFPVFPVSV